MAVENAQWVIFAQDNALWPPYHDFYYNYYIRGDTIINDISYKKVYYREFIPVGEDMFPATLGESIFVAAIRDDIPNRQVFVWMPPTFLYTNACTYNEESLFYDFSMQIGDNYGAMECGFQFGDSQVLYDISYQNIFGAERQIQYIAFEGTWDEDIRRYEGVGSNAGLLEWNCKFECPYYKFLIDYCVGDDQTCLQQYLLDTQEQTITQNIKVFPNPVNEQLQIQTSNLSAYKVTLYTLYGKKLFQKTSNQPNTSLDMQNLNSGIYMVTINNKPFKIVKK